MIAAFQAGLHGWRTRVRRNTAAPYVWVALLGLCSAAPAIAQSIQAAPLEPEVEDLGDQRYRINRIEIDRGKQRFSVPASILKLPPDSPLEYLATTRGGMKAYESLLEVDATAVDFNLACILIGLEAGQSNRLRYQFDVQPATGDPVALWVSWEQDGQVQRKKAVELMRIAGRQDEQNSDDWVYTGSMFSPPPDKQFMASLTGTLIGFVHDPNSIIEHRMGLGIGAYGAITLDPAYAPLLEQPLTLTVERLPRNEAGEPR